MARRGATSCLLAFVVAVGLAGVSRAGEEPRYQIIVHPENPTAVADADFLRKAFLKKSTDWGHGQTIRPIDLTTQFPERARFTREIIKKTPAQLRSYWHQQIFSGKGVPPPEVASPADVIAYVLAEPGAVGYLPAAIDPGGAKVLRVE